MLQQGRNFLMWLADQEFEATHLIHDRDTKFTKSFDHLLGSAGIHVLKSPVMAPNANAFAESWIATLRRECFMCFSLKHIDHIVQRFVVYYNEHRPHQGVGSRVLSSSNGPKLQLLQQNESIGSVGCRSELGGLLKHYYRQAA